MYRLLLPALLFWFNCAIAQTPELYSRVEILLNGRPITELAQLGVETDHGEYRPDVSLTTDLSASELAQVQAAGIETRVLIQDVSAWYVDPARNQVGAEERSGGCTPVGKAYKTPANYTYGSMNGYHTYAQLLAVLDDMRAKFPNLITQRAPAHPTKLTHEGRPLWYVKISDNPAAEEDEPEVLYTALHHAREANSLSQLLFFMWYLLENYEQDPQIKYLVDNTELYIIPCVNPDGYLYNEQTNPAGGGMWRKNRRLNGDGTYGVDLNRNYGYQWGYSNSGSSPTTSAQSYRGPSAFSEPETQIVRDFCLAHDFQFASNCHTYGNYLIYPWAYNDQIAFPDFDIYARFLTCYNNYLFGTPTQTVGYAVNGSSDDWMYGGAGIFSYTPEVGKTGFWPAFSQIDPLNKSQLWPNLNLALLTLRHGDVQDVSTDYLTTLTPELPFTLRRLGREDGPMTVSLAPLSANVLAVSAPQTYDLALFQEIQNQFTLTLSPDIQTGETVQLLLQLDNGSYVQTDTLLKHYGDTSVVALSNPGDNLNGWQGGWGVTGDTYVSEPSCITDSPTGVYAPASTNILKTAAPVSIPAHAVQPRLRFYACWEIEAEKDYAQVRILHGGNQFTALCGRYTHPGTAAQSGGKPVYDGLQDAWVEECIDLSDYIGQNITLGFAMVSDPAQFFDGIYIDDIVIEYLDTLATPATRTVQLPAAAFRMLPAQPNPASGSVLLAWENNDALAGPAELTLRNPLGLVVHRQTVFPDREKHVMLDVSAWEAGVYYYNLSAKQGVVTAGKMVVVR